MYISGEGNVVYHDSTISNVGVVVGGSDSSNNIEYGDN